jgi:NTP pyrophosphatase (non-canonical NTP hydrolase)
VPDPSPVWTDKVRPYQSPRVRSDILVTEFAEAMEEHRSGRQPAEVYQSDGDKPEGIPIELADVVIRILDFCGRWGIDLEDAMREKMAYNWTLPHRHGGKVE